MDELAKNSKFVETYSIGKSYEGRDIKALKINTANSNKIFWIDGGHSELLIASLLILIKTFFIHFEVS
jgi:hypothetical protein